MVNEALSETQCDSCFEKATSGRTLNGVCVVSPAVVHCLDCALNLCVSCCSRHCKMRSSTAPAAAAADDDDDDVRYALLYSTG